MRPKLSAPLREGVFRLQNLKDCTAIAAARNRLNGNHLPTARFTDFLPMLESGSGPWGRRFKSSRPDHYFETNTNFFKIAENRL
jgi:hypothetical protein